MLTFSFVFILRIPFSLSDLIPNASFLRNLINDQNFFNLFRLRSVVIWAVVLKHKYIGNVFPIGISKYLLYICSEPLVMNLDIRVLGIASKKVKIMSFKYTLQSSNLIKPIPLINKPHLRLSFINFKWYCFYQKYDKRGFFDFEIVNIPFLDGDVPRSTSYGDYISQLICFARASSYVTDFSTRNKLYTRKLF